MTASSLSTIALKAACALVESGASRGSGFLVESDAVLTCYHVVRDATRGLRVRFAHGDYAAEVVRTDVENDCALLRLAEPVRAVQPLPLATAPVQAGAGWEAYGFPAATLDSGLLVSGEIQDPDGEDPRHRPSIQLYSRHLTAGAHPHGMSGSPVMAGGHVVGQLRQIIADERGGGQFGTLYACPSPILARLVPGASRSSANPYRGLATFQSDDAPFFFGREALIEKLWLRLKTLYDDPARTRLLAILGPSGSGKSSLARAGLLAALAARPLSASPPRLVLLKPGPHPFRALALALLPPVGALPSASELGEQRRLSGELQQPSGSGELDGLGRWAANLAGVDESPLVLFVDQFEELYTLCEQPAEREAFVATLVHAAADRSRPVCIVITLRADFFGQTQRQHPKLNRLIAEQHELVPVMSEDELRRVIVEPARRAGRPLDPAIAEQLLGEVQRNKNALPLLEFALTRIWERRAAGQPESVTLQALGGVGGSVAAKAQEIFDALSGREQTIARRALVRLVRMGEGGSDTRRPMPLGELAGRGETADDVLAVLRRFAAPDARLVTLLGQPAESGETIAEVTHEALFEHWHLLRRWIQESRDDRKLHDHIAAAARRWQEAGRPPGRLFRTPDLEQLRAYAQRKEADLNDLQLAFFHASVKRFRLERVWRQGALVGGAALLFIVIAILISWRADTQRRLLDSYIKLGREKLTQGESAEALRWLQRAYAGGIRQPTLSYLLASAMRPLGALKMSVATNTSVIDVSTQIRAGRLSYDAAFSPDNSRFITTSGEGSAQIWDVASGKLVMELKGHSAWMYAASYSPDGTRIATASEDRSVIVWDASSGERLLKLRGHSGPVYDASFSPDGRQIATASADQTVAVFDARTGKVLARLQGHEASVRSVAFSPDGRRLLSAGADHIARVWSVDSQQTLLTLKGHQGTIWDAAFSADGHRIVTASEDHSARIWDADAGTLLFSLTGHRRGINKVGFSPDGGSILTASADQSVRIWDAPSGHLRAELPGLSPSAASAAFSPNGQLIVTMRPFGDAQIWDAAVARPMSELRGPWKECTSARYSPDGHHIVTTNGDRAARIWDPRSGKIVLALEGHADTVTQADYSPDGRRIITASRDRSARVWDADSGTLLLELKGHADEVLTASFSADGRRVVTGSTDKTARIWNADSGALITEYKEHRAPVSSAGLSHDGRRVVTGSLDWSIEVWGVAPMRQHISMGHSGPIVSASFSRDGRMLVASRDGTIRVWSIEPGLSQVLINHEETELLSAGFSPDGRRIVTTGAGSTVRIWDAYSGELLDKLDGHHDIVYSAAFSPDGRRLVTASRDGTARVWDVGPETRSPQQIEAVLKCHFSVFVDSRHDGDVVRGSAVCRPNQ